ncbi:MAG: ABC transporter permease [Rhodospirillaceae bacterium]|nr:ABC transporter permease [Rhodospirillaceae bacterium]
MNSLNFHTIPWSARIGMVMIVIMVFLGIAGPWIAPYTNAELVGDVWEPMFGNFLLGTDNLGRDMLSRLLYGARITLFIAFVATLISFTMGAVLGFFAAVQKGWLDQVLSRGNDTLMALPTLIFALVVLSVLPANLFTLIMVMAVLDSTRVYRIGRAIAVDIEALDFIEMARLRGEKKSWIILHEILPNALTPLIAEFGLRFSFAILFLSSLSFLGLGVQPPAADWGALVKENKDGIAFGISASLVPATAIAILTISVNLVADWLLSKTSDLKGGEG